MKVITINGREYTVLPVRSAPEFGGRRHIAELESDRGTHVGSIFLAPNGTLVLEGGSHRFRSDHLQAGLAQIVLSPMALAWLDARAAERIDTDTWAAKATSALADDPDLLWSDLQAATDTVRLLARRPELLAAWIRAAGESRRAQS